MPNVSKTNGSKLGPDPIWHVGGIFSEGAGFKLAIDDTVITTLTASDQGTVSYTLDPAALGLSHGHHVLTLQGMLITTTASFRS